MNQITAIMILLGPFMIVCIVYLLKKVYNNKNEIMLEDDTTQKEDPEEEEEKIEEDIEWCKNCTHFDVEKGEDVGECHRYPPFHNTSKRDRFPSVSKDDWCSEMSE